MRAGTGRQVNVNHRRAGPVRAQSRVLCLSDNLDDEVLDLRTACRRDRSPSRGRHARVVVGPDPTRGLVARGHATDVEPFVLLGDVWLGGASSSCQGKSSPRVVLSASKKKNSTKSIRRALSHTFHSALYRGMASCAQTGSLRPGRSRSLDLMPRTCWWSQPCKRYGSTLPMVEGKGDMVTFCLVPGVVFGCFVLRQAEETNRARSGQDQCWVSLLLPERSTISP